MSKYDEMRKELKHSIIDLDADHYNLSEFMRVIDEVFLKYRDCMEKGEEKSSNSSSDVIIPIYIEATKQSTTAKLKLEVIAETGMSVAILYDIPIDLKPFPMFTKVRVHGKESEFYLGKDGTLIQKDCKPFDLWFGK